MRGGRQEEHMNSGRLISDLMNSVERAMAKIPCSDRRGPAVDVRTDISLPHALAVPAALLYQVSYGLNGRVIEVM
jgi:hypothetical protein